MRRRSPWGLDFAQRASLSTHTRTPHHGDPLATPILNRLCERHLTQVQLNVQTVALRPGVLRTLPRQADRVQRAVANLGRGRPPIERMSGLRPRPDRSDHPEVSPARLDAVMAERPFLDRVSAVDNDIDPAS